MRESSDAFPVLATLLDAVTAELQASGLDESLCAKALYPGEQVPQDYGAESCGGMVFVRLVNAYPSAAFPSPATGLQNCVATLALTVEVGVLRPAPAPVEHLNGDLDLPTDAEHIEATAYQMADMEALYRAIRSAPIDLKVVGTYTPIGPAGFVVGGAWTATVGRDL